MTHCEHLLKRDDDDHIPIITATVDGHDGCILTLIRSGADVNDASVESSDGDTALISAVKYRRDKCMDVLLKAGADVNVQNIFGETALHKAAEFGLLRYVQLLVQSGAIVNETDGKGKTPLIRAARYGHFKCVDELIRSGADVNKGSIRGTTALISAAASNNIRIVYLLLKQGAWINMTKTENENALQYCLRHYKPNILNIATFLYVAGEKLDGITVKRKDDESDYMFKKREETLEYLKQRCSRLCFEHICRESIRSQLILVNPHIHLFDTVPKIGLPTKLVSYLLYGLSLYSN